MNETNPHKFQPQYQAPQSAWRQKLRKISIALSTSMLMVAAAPQTQAQDTAPALEEVVVTGTYLKGRSQADNPSPTTVIGLDDFNAIGAVNV